MRRLLGALVEDVVQHLLLVVRVVLELALPWLVRAFTAGVAGLLVDSLAVADARLVGLGHNATALRERAPEPVDVFISVFHQPLTPHQTFRRPVVEPLGLELVHVVALHVIVDAVLVVLVRLVLGVVVVAQHVLVVVLDMRVQERGRLAEGVLDEPPPAAEMLCSPAWHLMRLPKTSCAQSALMHWRLSVARPPGKRF